MAVICNCTWDIQTQQLVKSLPNCSPCPHGEGWAKLCYGYTGYGKLERKKNFRCAVSATYAFLGNHCIT